MKSKLKAKYVCVISVGIVTRLWDITQMNWASNTSRVKMESFRSTLPPIDRLGKLKRQGRERDHSHSPAVQVKNTWIYISTSLYDVTQWCLITTKGRKNFILLAAQDIRKSNNQVG